MKAAFMISFLCTAAFCAAPPWFTNMPEKTWVTPVSNWLGADGVKDPLAGTTNRGNTGHSAIVGAWTGMGADQTRNTLFMMHNGGHMDYLGNEVYSCDLRAASPAWMRRRNASVHDGSGSIQKFSDGRPCADHTATSHVAAEGRWFTAGMTATNYLGYPSFRQWWEYDLAAEDYIDRYSAAYAQGYIGVSGAALFDPEDRQIITCYVNNAQPAIQFVNLDNLSVAHQINNPTINYGGNMTAGLDKTNHLLVLRYDSEFKIIDLDDKSGAWTTVTATGTPSPLSMKAPLYWHAPSQAFITWGGGGTVKKLTPTVVNGNYTALAWSDITPASGGVTPPASGPGTGMYNKIQIIDDMGNGQSALVVVPRYAFPDVFVYRMPGLVTAAQRPAGHPGQGMISVNPNPFKSRVVITIDKELQVTSYKLSIFNINGKQLETCNLKLATRNSFSWNASGLPAGVYLLKATVAGKTLTKRLFLQK